MVKSIQLHGDGLWMCSYHDGDLLRIVCGVQRDDPITAPYSGICWPVEQVICHWESVHWCFLVAIGRVSNTESGTSCDLLSQCRSFGTGMAPATVSGYRTGSLKPGFPRISC